jgi:putative FmdB family regulatory protein
MPIYEYRCPDGHLFEVFKSIHAPAPEACPVCGKGPLEVVLHPVAVHFKGSGFYNTDYGTAKRKRETAASAESGADKHDAKQAEKKSSSDSASSDSKPASS